MLERFSAPPAPEIPVQQLVHTLVVMGKTQGANVNDLVLDHPTRIASLAAGLLVTAGLAKMIAVFSSSHGTNLVKNYLNDIDVPTHSISNNSISEHLDEALEIKKFVKENGDRDIGIITTHGTDRKLKDAFSKVGLKMSTVSLEDEIGQKIANSAKNSHHVITEILKESVLSLVRFQKMLDEVKISRITLV